jgi:hypothetical protein
MFAFRCGFGQKKTALQNVAKIYSGAQARQLLKFQPLRQYSWAAIGHPLSRSRSRAAGPGGTSQLPLRPSETAAFSFSDLSYNCVAASDLDLPWWGPEARGAPASIAKRLPGLHSYLGCLKARAGGWLASPRVLQHVRQFHTRGYAFSETLTHDPHTNDSCPWSTYLLIAPV